MAKEYDLATFRGRLRSEARRLYGSLRGLAEASGVNYQTLSEYDENALPSGPILVKLRTAGIDPSYLLPTGATPSVEPQTYRPPTPELLERAGAKPMTPEGWADQVVDGSPEGIAGIMLQRVLALYERQAERNREELREELERIGGDIARR